MQNQAVKWLERIEFLFMNHGIRSVTMDDIAKELGISKKTLYNWMPSKNDLVLLVVQTHIANDQKRIQSQMLSAGNAVEALLRMIACACEDVQEIKSNTIFDLQKYHHDAWDIINEYHKGFVYNMVLDNLKQGIVESLYRSDFNPEIMARLHVAQSFSIFDQSLFPSNTYHLSDVFRTSLMHYLHGIVSDKGNKLLLELNN